MEIKAKECWVKDTEARLVDNCAPDGVVFYVMLLIEIPLNVP